MKAQIENAFCEAYGREFSITLEGFLDICKW